MKKNIKLLTLLFLSSACVPSNSVLASDPSIPGAFPGESTALTTRPSFAVALPGTNPGVPTAPLALLGRYVHQDRSGAGSEIVEYNLGGVHMGVMTAADEFDSPELVRIKENVKHLTHDGGTHFSGEEYEDSRPGSVATCDRSILEAYPKLINFQKGLNDFSNGTLVNELDMLSKAIQRLQQDGIIGNVSGSNPIKQVRKKFGELVQTIQSLETVVGDGSHIEFDKAQSELIEHMTSLRSSIESLKIDDLRRDDFLSLQSQIQVALRNVYGDIQRLTITDLPSAFEKRKFGSFISNTDRKKVALRQIQDMQQTIQNLREVSPSVAMLALNIIPALFDRVKLEGSVLADMLQDDLSTILEISDEAVQLFQVYIQGRIPVDAKSGLGLSEIFELPPQENIVELERVDIAGIQRKLTQVASMLGNMKNPRSSFSGVESFIANAKRLTPGEDAHVENVLRFLPAFEGQRAKVQDLTSLPIAQQSLQDQLQHFLKGVRLINRLLAEVVKFSIGAKDFARGTYVAELLKETGAMGGAGGSSSTTDLAVRGDMPFELALPAGEPDAAILSTLSGYKKDDGETAMSNSLPALQQEVSKAESYLAESPSDAAILAGISKLADKRKTDAVRADEGRIKLFGTMGGSAAPARPSIAAILESRTTAAVSPAVPVMPSVDPLADELKFKRDISLDRAKSILGVSDVSAGRYQIELNSGLVDSLSSIIPGFTNMEYITVPEARNLVSGLSYVYEGLMAEVCENNPEIFKQVLQAYRKMGQSFQLALNLDLSKEGLDLLGSADRTAATQDRQMWTSSVTVLKSIAQPLLEEKRANQAGAAIAALGAMRK